MIALLAIAALAATAQAGLLHGGLGYGHAGLGLGYAGHGIGHGVAVAKVATPIIANSAVTSRADHWSPIIGKALAPVGVAKVGVAAAPIGLGLGYGGYGYGGYGYGGHGLGLGLGHGW